MKTLTKGWKNAGSGLNGHQVWILEWQDAQTGEPRFASRDRWECWSQEEAVRWASELLGCDPAEVEVAPGRKYLSEGGDPAGRGRVKRQVPRQGRPSPRGRAPLGRRGHRW